MYSICLSGPACTPTFLLVHAPLIECGLWAVHVPCCTQRRRTASCGLKGKKGALRSPDALLRVVDSVWSGFDNEFVRCSRC